MDNLKQSYSDVMIMPVYKRKFFLKEFALKQQNQQGVDKDEEQRRLQLKNKAAIEGAIKSKFEGKK